MSGRRRLAVVAGSALATTAVAVALAAPSTALTIREFRVEATVTADTSLTVTERITYDYGSEYLHGFYRDIPVYDTMPDGSRRAYDVAIASVTMDGAAVPWTTSDNDPFVNVRIGDPDVTITGAHEYVLTYTVQNALRVITADDLADPLVPDTIGQGDVELYWDLIGNENRDVIDAGSAVVLGPTEPLAAACYTGAYGSAETCPVAAHPGGVALGPVFLVPGEALTASVVWPADAFSQLPIEDIAAPPLNPLWGVAGTAVPALLFIIIPVVSAGSRRRQDAGAPIPGAPPQYAAPDGLAPAQMAAAWKGSAGAADPRAMLATLLDLAARRWINVRTKGKHLGVEWVGRGEEPMRPWEERLVAQILRGSASVTMEGYDSVLATQWKADFRGLVDEQGAAGRRNDAGDAPDQRWTWIGLTAGVLLVGGIVGLFLIPAILAWASLTLGLGALIGFTAARIITPRRQTPQSARFLAKVAGLEKVLGTDPAASRREFAQRSGLSPIAIFATMLPFAVVLDLEDSWLGAFPDLTAEQLGNYGLHVGSMYAMSSLMSTGTSSMRTATTAPSSGSGGGGYSGGGGGGGGSGTW